jgi:hypothetical protein
MLLPRHKAPKEYVADPLGCDIRNQLYVGLPSVFGGPTSGDWDATSRFPKVTLSRPLGEAGEIAVETEALLVQHGFGRRGTDGDFSPEVLSCLENFRRPTKDASSSTTTISSTSAASAATSAAATPSSTVSSIPSDDDDPRTGWTIPPEELSRRRDLRSTRIFSIDPTTAKDLGEIFFSFFDVCSRCVCSFLLKLTLCFFCHPSLLSLFFCLSVSRSVCLSVSLSLSDFGR